MEEMGNIKRQATKYAGSFDGRTDRRASQERMYYVVFKLAGKKWWKRRWGASMRIE